MVEQTAGKRLSEARLARGLSLDAAAHATRMRPDKILALENDDFSRFGSSAYAKGFLLMYGRYLKVDVSAELQDLTASDPGLGTQEYQYLNNAPQPKEQDRTPLPRGKSKAPSVVPLLAFVALCVLAVMGLRLWGYVHQLGLDRPSESQAVEMMALKPAPLLASTTNPPTETPVPEAAPTETEAAASMPIASAPAETEASENELSVESLKKTLVTIRRDRNSPPLFEDYVYPNGKLLKVHGTTFFIEVRDETAVQIRKNGQPIAYQAPGVVIE